MNTAVKIIGITVLTGGLGFLAYRLFFKKKEEQQPSADQISTPQPTQSITVQTSSSTQSVADASAPSKINVYNGKGNYLKQATPSELTILKYDTKKYFMGVYSNELDLFNQPVRGSNNVLKRNFFAIPEQVNKSKVSQVSYSNLTLVGSQKDKKLYLIDDKNAKYVTSTAQVS